MIRPYLVMLAAIVAAGCGKSPAPTGAGVTPPGASRFPGDETRGK